MKPDGVATMPADPTEVVVEPENDTESNGQPQTDQSPQPENSENVQTVENSTAALSQNEFNGKMLDPKTKTKVPGKTKPSTAGTKASNTSGVASRPATAQGRVPNGVAKAASNSLAKKPVAVTSDNKKTTSFGVGAQPKKGPTASAVEPRTQVKAAERKPVWAAKSAVTSANGGTRPQTASTVQSAASKKPPSASSSAAVKPKTTASRPATAPTAKLGVSAAPKAAPVSKATRPTTAPISRSTTSVVPSRSATTVTKSSVPKTTVTASSAVLSASSQPSKVSTVGARKDIKTSTSAPVRKPLASTTTRPTAIKTSKPKPPKPGVAAKRPTTEPKTSQTKTDETRHVPTRKVQPSPRNTPTRPTARNQQQGGTTPVLKRQTTKPTQSVSPLVIKEKSVKDSTSECAEPSVDLASVTSVATAEVTVPAESVPEVLAPLAVELEEQPDQHSSEPVEVQRDGVPDSNPSNVDINFTMKQAITDALATETVAEEPNVVSSSPTAVSPEPESKKANDCFLNEAPTAHKTTQEPVIASASEVLVAAKMSPKGLEVAEKSEQIIHSVDDEEEEEKECSQQVSVSDMSGTQPTEESRPGSAGFAGSVWRAGGLLSELDSEDVSCSQQGASELSAPGVLEGTESMDDLGEASLKGADGDGASVGSPDLEKVPDIPNNEDDEDHVCDMDVGSEMADDSHKHGHDNDDDDDVEMASEGITESGLESYGNADEDDFAEDYRLDNLNRMQPLSTVPSAAPWGQANTSPDLCMPPLSTVPSAGPWGQANTSPDLCMQSLSTIPSAAPWGQANASPDPCMQPLSTVTFAAPCGQANTSPDPCMKSPQPDPTFLSGPSSKPWQTDSESPTQEPAETPLGVESVNEAPSSPDLPGEPAPRSPQSTSMHELDPCLKQDLTFHSQAMSPSSTLHGPELANTCSNKSMPEELEDFNACSEINPVSVLPDIAQDLGSHLDQDEVEEPETLPADDKIACLTTAQTSVPSSPLLTTGDETSDTEGEMQISKPNIETGSTGNGCLNSKEDIHHLSASGECEEACVELEGGGDTPQSATSGASYGFNSNAHSSTESCTKSPGIFSLENEEQLTDEAKDPSLIKELTLASTDDVLDPVQQSENQLNTEQQYMLCGKVSDELPESSILGAAVPAETGLNSIFSSQHQEDWDLDAPHPYFSTICDKTDTSLPGRVRPPKHHNKPRVDHVIHVPHLSTDVLPRMPSQRGNAQLIRLEHHQQQLKVINQRREQQSKWAKGPEGCVQGDENKVEKNRWEKEDDKRRTWEEEENELEKQRRDLLQLQIQQQQQELKQRQQIIQWQEELKQQSKLHNRPNNAMTTVRSPSGLGTIYETLETSDSEENYENEGRVDIMIEKKVKHESLPKETCLITNPTNTSPPIDDTDSPYSESTASSPELTEKQERLTYSSATNSPPLLKSNPPQCPFPLEVHWGKRADLVQQLINQTLLVAGSNCSPRLLLPEGAAGTLSPLETRLWPNLAPLTPSSATVTSVSSFSPEISGSSSQGEWTVVELETHH